jgi:protocatechuate 3,4-dioxygenase beta subunit
VTDPVGAAIPKAHVEATNQDTNVKHETETDDRGVYRFTDLQPGMYRVRVGAASFKTLREVLVSEEAHLRWNRVCLVFVCQIAGVG